jgi:hypothetical protein
VMALVLAVVLPVVTWLLLSSRHAEQDAADLEVAS